MTASAASTRSAMSGPVLARTWHLTVVGQVTATYHGPRTQPRVGARERYHKLSPRVVHQVTYRDESHGPENVLAGHTCTPTVEAIGQRMVDHASGWRQTSSASASLRSACQSTSGAVCAPRLVTAGGGVPMIDRPAGEAAWPCLPQSGFVRSGSVQSEPAQSRLARSRLAQPESAQFESVQPASAQPWVAVAPFGPGVPGDVILATAAAATS
jgi:hypothetical protein